MIAPSSRGIGSLASLLAAVLLASGACSGSEDSCVETPNPTIAIGDGFDETFEPVGEGERILLLINGSGRYALRVALRTGQIATDDARVLARVVTNGQIVGATDVRPEDGEPGTIPSFDLSGSFDQGELVFAPLTFRADVQPATYINMPATLQVTITDSCGTVATTEQGVVPWWQF